jgi:hypothetical protein
MKSTFLGYVAGLPRGSPPTFFFREMSADVYWTMLDHVPRDEVGGACHIHGRNTSFCKETE